MLHLQELRSSTASYIESVKAEIDGEPANLRYEIESAQAAATSDQAKIRDVGEKNRELLERSRVLWNLIGGTTDNAKFPDMIRNLCASLQTEITRRLGTSVESLISGAEASKFELQGANALLDQHVLTAYVADRDQLRDRLAESASALGSIQSALTFLDSLKR